MNKDSNEGAARTTLGKVEETAGRTPEDKHTTGQGLYDQAAGNVQGAYGQAKDAITSGASEVAKDASATYAKAKDAVSQGAKTAIDSLANSDFGALRDDLAKLTQTVSQLAQAQAASTRDQIMDVEADLEARIQKNPWSAVAIALGVGILIGKMT